MKLSPSSDESWQWCFLIMSNKKLRKLSKIFSIKPIPKSQKISLYKENKKNYDKINNNEIKLSRPSNGLSGTLYPPNTFTDKRFFDEDIFMKLSPSSDESWQWCFLIMSNKKLRKLSKNFSIKPIPKSQKISLYKENKKNYNKITKNLYEYFPEFKKQLEIRIKECYKTNK